MAGREQPPPESVLAARRDYRRQRAFASTVIAVTALAFVLVSFAPGVGEPFAFQGFMLWSAIALVITVPVAWLVAILMTTDHPSYWHRLAVTVVAAIGFVVVAWIAFGIFLHRQGAIT